MSAAVYAPELLFWDGALRPGLSLEVDASGRIAGVVAGVPAHAVRLGRRALLPGLVNGHSHAFQRLIRGRVEYVGGGAGRDDFWSWRERMYQAANALDPEGVFVASRQAFLEMAHAGITTVGEFHYLHHQPDGTPYRDREELAHQVIRAAREVGLRICLLRVGYARAGYKVDPNPRQRRFIDATPLQFLGSVEALASAYAGDAQVNVGLAPHSVRAMPREWLVAARDGAGGRVVHMHVAEQPAEIAACRAEHDGETPVELLKELGLLGPRFTAVHAVHLQSHEVGMLGGAQVTICACPSTERNLGDGIVQADALLAAGAQVSLGSDSQVSIDLLDDARQLESHLRLLRLRRAVLDPGRGDVAGLAARLLRCATESGARSLGMDVGTLAPGKLADFFAVDLDHPSLIGADTEAVLPALLFGGDKAAIRDVFVAGQWIVRDGRHRLDETAPRAYAALAGRIFA